MEELIHFENINFINYQKNCDAVAVKCMQPASGWEMKRCKHDPAFRLIS